MLDETTKQHWLKLGTIAVLTFLTAFLAFYIVMEIMLHRLNNPVYQVKRIEKIFDNQMNLRNLDDIKMDNPFVPRMRPMIVNLVKEANEYKVIVDLEPLNGDEKAVNVNIQTNELTVRGEMDKKSHGAERIINFSQTYYLDEKPEVEKMVKEKKGNKYIITIPFED